MASAAAVLSPHHPLPLPQCVWLSTIKIQVIEGGRKGPEHSFCRSRLREPTCDCCDSLNLARAAFGRKVGKSLI